MSVLVSNVAVEKYNELGIPEVINITFTNGEKVSYQKSRKCFNEGSQLSKFQRPKYDIDEKIGEVSFDALGERLAVQSRLLQDQYMSAVNEAERLLKQEKQNIQSFLEGRVKACDQLYASLSKEMLGDYQILKKKIHRKMEELKDPAKRLKRMIGWLRETKMPELILAAEMLELAGDYFLKKLKSPNTKWDGFLSHVQKASGDACRNIQGSCKKLGLELWFDKNADRLDNRGMADGVVDSSVFVLVLTKDYFRRPYCVYEYCLAVVAGRAVITVFDSDARYGGGPLDSFQLGGLFKHLLNHQIIEIHREYWSGFIAKLHARIKKTMKSHSITTILREDHVESSILNQMGIAFLEEELQKDGLGLGTRLYSTEEHGETLIGFHSKCDHQGATLTVIESKDGMVFGGFTSASWSTRGCWVTDKAAWLFNLRSCERIDIKKDRSVHAIYCGSGCGPCFGLGFDLGVYADNKPARICSQKTYTKGIFSRSTKYDLKRYEVFKVTKIL